MSKPQEPQRIAKLLARAGIASRREIERMIADRRIALNGVPLETPATLLESLSGVTVDGQPVAAPAPARLFRFHKPAGVLTAERDFGGRRTIYDVLPRELPRVIPVGRLDLNTEGLLLLTTDGELKRQLELPSTQVKRTYRARAFGEISQAQLEDLIEGIEIEGVRYGSIDANLERRTGANVWIEMTLTEGKNREVRRVLEHLGLRVSRLIRTSYGPIPLADMPVGAVDEVRQHDLIQFRRELRLPADKRSNSPLTTRAQTPRARPEEREAAPAEQPQKGPRVKPDAPRTATPRKAEAGPGGRPPRGARPDSPAGKRPAARPARGEPERDARNPADRFAKAPRDSAKPATGKAKPIRRRAEPEVLETSRKRLQTRSPGEDRGPRPPRRTGPSGRKPGAGGPRKGPR